MTTKKHVRTLACTTLTLLPLVAFGCDDGPATGSGMQATAGAAAPAMTPAANAPQTPSQQPSDKPSDTPAKPSDTPAKPADTKPSMQPGMQPSASTPSTTPGTNTDPKPSTEPAAGADFPDLRGKCSIKSSYPGDETCISAPNAEEGMQLHVGPKDYADTSDVAKYLLDPGEETSLCWTLQTPNDQEIWYQGSVLSGRAGTHHIINTMFPAGTYPDAGFARCGDASKAIGSIPGASKAYMPRTHVAPEYADVGRSIPSHATIQADMHYFNFTDKPLVREFWMNIYFAKKEEIKREALQIRGMGGFGWTPANPIAPGTDMVYKYSCPVKGNGHILNLLGHYHAHGKRFTAYITRKGSTTPEKVFEMFDYLDPAVFEYNTVITNPTFAEGKAGALSGQLAISDGDVLAWECHIVNDSDVGLTYVNEVKTGEMCNLWGSSLGIDKWNCLKQ